MFTSMLKVWAKLLSFTAWFKNNKAAHCVKQLCY
jgi:hypothetical protein